MKTAIKLYSRICKMVSFMIKRLKLDRFKRKLGRKLALSLEDIISLSLFKQRNGIETKKALYEIFEPRCSYKTMVVSMNRFYVLGIIILLNVIRGNRKNQHIIKHIDSTDIPVCLFKNANSHKTMRGLARSRHLRLRGYLGSAMGTNSPTAFNFLTASLAID